MRHLATAIAALCLAACGDNSPPPQQPAETREQYLAAVAAEAERIERAYAAEVEAENRRKLEEMRPFPEATQEAAYVPDPVNDWFAMNPEHIFCESLTARTGDATPDQFLGRALANGGSVARVDVGDDAIQVIDRNDPRPATTIVFVKGLENCRAYLQRAQEQAGGTS